MPNKIVIIEDDGKQSEVITDGYLLIHAEGDKFLFKGKLGMKALAPLLTKILIEKMK